MLESCSGLEPQLRWAAPCLLPTPIYRDERGCFYEAYREEAFSQALGSSLFFLQDNYSHSRRGVLRGLHYQKLYPQGKLVRVLSGAIFDVAVDLREASPSFGQWQGFWLDGEKAEGLWIPPGFAHGFLSLSEQVHLYYKCTDYYHPEDEKTIAWDDPTLGISWPLEMAPQLSARDRAAATFLEQFPHRVESVMGR